MEEILPLVSDHDFTPTKEDRKSHPQSVFMGSDLKSNLVDVCGVLLPKKKSSNGNTENKKDKIFLVYTETSVKNLRALGLALSRGNPILLEGVTGSGKSTLVKELMKITENYDMISVHLGDQSDSKMLLGTYICTEVPGEFKWQPGALAQAVSEGKWILIEDIDLAPVEVVSVLLPLLETRKLFIPGRGEEIRASSGFQIFATQTLSSRNKNKIPPSLTNLWNKVVVEPLSLKELKIVLNSIYPHLKNHIPLFIETFQMLTEPNSKPKQSENLASFSISHLRHLSSRDLLKWVHRIDLFCDIPTGNTKLNLNLKQKIFQEAFDCFCAMIPKQKLRITVMNAIGKVLELFPNEIEFFLSSKPCLQITKESFEIGRSTLNISSQSILSLKEKRPFAYTKHSLKLIERISVSVELNEPVLLVGETGTGNF